jgi:hypothetical protein
MTPFDFWVTRSKVKVTGGLQCQNGLASEDRLRFETHMQHNNKKK